MKYSTILLFALLTFSSCDEQNEGQKTADSLVQPVVQAPATKADSIAAKLAGGTPDTSALQALPAVIEGDIIFQDAPRGKLLGEIAKEKYNHCGIVFMRKRDNQFVVAEAGDSVKLTPLQEWINSGSGKHLAIYRLKDVNTVLSKKRLDKIRASMARYKNKTYDEYFSWSDEKLYSTEFVWKAYHDGTGYRLCEPKSLKSLDLTGASVSKKLKEFYGAAVPDTVKVVMPVDLMTSPLLEKAFER